MGDAPHSRRQHLVQAAAFGAAVLGVPALLRREGKPLTEAVDGPAVEREFFNTGRKSYDSRPREVLAKERAEFLFFGDSMVKAHIDAELASQMTGKRCGIFFLPRSTSARWYLMLKYHVIPSGVKPRKLFVLFRNCIWHMPELRVSESDWDDLERTMEDPNDPVMEQVLGLTPRHSASGANVLLEERLYPVQRQRESLQLGVQEMAAQLMGQDFDQLKAAANARTSWENFRGGMVAEPNYEGYAGYSPFTMAADKSFFPHFLALAEKEGIPLHFIRLRRRPTKKVADSDHKDVPIYMAEMKALLKERGYDFTDLSGDTAVTAEMFAEGDHLDVKHRSWFTKRLIEKLGSGVFA
jgi:hypothetical protein